MLVLTRKIGESIIVGNNIKVTITSIERNKVRIGIEAPPEVRVDREEVWKRVMEFAEPELVESGV